MTKDNILALCNHIRQRQNDFGSAEGFRFKSYFHEKRMVDAEYGRQADEEVAAARAKKQRESRKQKNKERQMNKVLNEKEAETRTQSGPTENLTLTESRTSPAAFDPQIDPSLQQMSRHVEHMPDQEELPDPQGGGHIDFNSMRLLIGSEYENTIPVNGPNDGPPSYFVSAAALQFLSQLNATQSGVGSEIGHMEPEGPLNEPTEKVGGNGKRRNEDVVEQPRRSNRINKKPADGQTPQISTRSQNKRGKGRKK